jgi:hypothetical protein
VADEARQQPGGDAGDRPESQGAFGQLDRRPRLLAQLLGVPQHRPRLRHRLLPALRQPHAATVAFE